MEGTGVETLSFWDIELNVSAVPWGRHWQADPYHSPQISEVRTAAQQLRPGERLGETEIGTLAEQNKNKMFSQHVWELKGSYTIKQICVSPLEA